MARQQKLSFAKDFAREVIPVPVADEMSESFLAYSLSVITARAIPDVRDGLKPVQRRILYSMLGMGLRPTNPHRKVLELSATLWVNIIHMAIWLYTRLLFGLGKILLVW